MLAARRRPRLPVPLRRRTEPKSLALLVDLVLARYGILPLEHEHSPQPVRQHVASDKQGLLFTK